MKTKDWFCRFDLLGLWRQSATLLLICSASHSPLVPRTLSGSERLQRRIYSLLFLIAGVLLIQSVQAQTLVDSGTPGVNVPAPTGMFDVTLNGGTDALFAHNGGTITGTG